MFYDAKFGRKRLPEPQDGQAADTPVSNGISSNVTSNGNHSVKNTSDMAIYEQYRNRVAHFFSHCDFKFKCSIFLAFLCFLIG